MPRTCAGCRFFWHDPNVPDAIVIKQGPFAGAIQGECLAVPPVPMLIPTGARATMGPLGQQMQAMQIQGVCPPVQDKRPACEKWQERESEPAEYRPPNWFDSKVGVA